MTKQTSRVSFARSKTSSSRQRLVGGKGGPYRIRFGLATRQTENTARLHETKRQIARILTILAERESRRPRCPASQDQNRPGCQRQDG